MNPYYDGRSDQGFLRSNEGVRQRETIYGNCLMLIVLPRGGNFQKWRYLAGSEGGQKKADIYNIYEGKALILVCDPLMVRCGT